MDSKSTVQTPSVLFQRRPAEKSSLRDGDDSSQSSISLGHSQTPSPHEASDLEKAETAEDPRNGTSTGACRNTSSARISRIQSLQQRRTVFEHHLSHVKTNADVVVDFDGPDDPYRPINWPFRKKVITTVLYGFTTMGSTFASSV